MTDTSPAPGGRRGTRRELPKPLLAFGLLLALSAITAGQARAAPAWPDEPSIVPAARAPAVAAGLPDLLGRLAAPGPSLALLDAARPPLVWAAENGGGPTPASLTLPAIVSGLPWRSGASCAEADFEAWRGRRLDVNVSFVAHRTWDEMYARLRGSWYRSIVRRSPQNVLSLPLFPHTHRKQHAACAAGAFDQHFREFGGLMVAGGGGAAIVRLGWEPNTGSGSHPWGIDGAADIPAYKACFRRLAGVLKAAAPQVRIEWTNAKKGKLPFSPLEANPGDDVVDLWGVHYYDSGPAMTTQAAWDERLHAATRRGGPFGIGAWLREAAARGKQIGVPEWGVWANGVTSAPDNPLYIENMYRFFRDNAAGIAYESYYNCPLRHRLFPSGPFPAASARYRELWSAGR